MTRPTAPRAIPQTMKHYNETFSIASHDIECPGLPLGPGVEVTFVDLAIEGCPARNDTPTQRTVQIKATVQLTAKVILHGMQCSICGTPSPDHPDADACRSILAHQTCNRLCFARHEGSDYDDDPRDAYPVAGWKSIAVEHDYGEPVCPDCVADLEDLDKDDVRGLIRALAAYLGPRTTPSEEDS